MAPKVYASWGAAVPSTLPGYVFWRQALGSLEGESQYVDMELTRDKHQKRDGLSRALSVYSYRAILVSREGFEPGAARF
jgi:hypothetical protein